jgi:hypothetical protein
MTNISLTPVISIWIRFWLITNKSTRTTIIREAEVIQFRVLGGITTLSRLIGIIISTLARELITCITIVYKTIRKLVTWPSMRTGMAIVIKLIQFTSTSSGIGSGEAVTSTVTLAPHITPTMSVNTTTLSSLITSTLAISGTTQRLIFTMESRILSSLFSLMPLMETTSSSIDTTQSIMEVWIRMTTFTMALDTSTTTQPLEPGMVSLCMSRATTISHTLVCITRILTTLCSK